MEVQIITKDFEHNDGQTCLYLEVVARVERLETDIDVYPEGTIYLQASPDYGRTWTTEVALPLQPSDNEWFIEKKIALHLRGKALRVKARSDGPYEIESIYIKFNPQGISFKYDR